MNTLFLTKLSWALIIIFILSFLTPLCIAGNDQQCNWAAVEQDSFAEILTMIENRVKENYDKINSWKGKTRIISDIIKEGDEKNGYYETLIDARPLPNKIKQHHEFVREFILDSNKGLLYEHFYPDGRNYIMDVDKGDKLRMKSLSCWASGKYIHTPDYHIDCLNNKNIRGEIVNHTVIKEARHHGGKRTCGGYLSPVFDPRDTMRIFGDVSGKRTDPLGGAFTRYINNYSKNSVKSVDGYPAIKVEECDIGVVKKYKITLIGIINREPKVYRFETMICSSDVGFNVVSKQETDPNDKIFKAITWEYALFNGVYLPTEKNELLFDDKTGDIKEQSSVIFFNEKVNEPIDEDVFTYKNLGLQDGDKFIDKIENKEYRYKEATKSLELVNENNK